MINISKITAQDLRFGKYKNDFPRKYNTVKYSMMNMPNREIEQYVSCKRSQISKNFTHFQSYCKDLAVKEGIIC